MELQRHDGGSLQVSDLVFGQNYNEPLIHQVLMAYMAGSRAGTKAQKTRAEVSGGGKKPWRQKGTGNARAGSIRSPIWRKGGITFAAVPRDFTQKVNRKMYEGAMRSIWSELVRQHRLVILDELTLSQPKTKELLQKLAILVKAPSSTGVVGEIGDISGARGVQKVLIIHNNIDRNLLLAARNLHQVQLCTSEAVNPATLIAFEQILITVTALKQIEERLQ